MHSTLITYMRTLSRTQTWVGCSVKSMKIRLVCMASLLTTLIMYKLNIRLWKNKQTTKDNTKNDPCFCCYFFLTHKRQRVSKSLYLFLMRDSEFLFQREILTIPVKSMDAAPSTCNSTTKPLAMWKRSLWSCSRKFICKYKTKPVSSKHLKTNNPLVLLPWCVVFDAGKWLFCHLQCIFLFLLWYTRQVELWKCV